MLRSRSATLTQLRAALQATPHRAGNGRRRTLLLESRAEPWSRAERELHELLRRAGITGWRANVAVVVRGKRYFLDVALSRLRLVIEVDGRRHHGPEQFESDRERQNALVLDGWTVLRFTWAMLIHQPDHVIAEVRAAIATARRRRP